MVVLPANVQDWDGAEEVIGRCGARLPRLARVWADAGYKAFIYITGFHDGQAFDESVITY